jgi:hypothetical protein
LIKCIISVLGQFLQVSFTKAFLHLATCIVFCLIRQPEGLCHKGRHQIVAIDNSFDTVLGKLAPHWQGGASEIREHHGPNKHERVFFEIHHFSFYSVLVDAVKG